MSPYLFAMIMDALARRIKDMSRGACYMLMTFYCVAPELRLLKRNGLPEVQFRSELGWKLGYQYTGRDFGTIEYV